MLLGERPFDRMASRLFLSRLMHDAIEDLAQGGAGPVPDLHERFLSFLHRVEPDHAGRAESNGAAGPDHDGPVHRVVVRPGAGLDGRA
jgi:hypothetical protein